MKSLENKVIYQVYPKSFLDTTGNGIGDLQGVIKKLDYLATLGVDYVWLSPICMSPQKDNGYDVLDYYKIDPMFGSNQDYENLIDECKKRGMKVMMDLVINHTSNEHIWFKKALEKDEKYYNYYIFRDKPNEIKSFFGGSAWEYSQELGQYYFKIFDKSQPDLNWANKDVREDIYKIVNFWIDKGVEGFRLDAIDLIGKEPEKYITGKGEMYYKYLEELNQNTFQDKILTVGECWGATIEETNKMCHPKGLTQAFNFHHILLTFGENKWFLKKLDLEKLAKTLDTWENKFNGINAQVMNNHDIPRLVSSWLDDKTYRVESAKLLITLFGLLKGNLYIYQGEEIGATNAYMDNINDYNDIETFNIYEELRQGGFEDKVIMDLIKKTSRDNARVPMQWSDEKNAGFTTGKPWLKINSNYKDVNVKKDLNSKDSIFKYYQSIIKFRKENYDLIDTKIKIKVDGDVLKFTRGKITFVANFSDRIIAMDKEKTPKFSNYEKVNNNYLRPYEVYVTI